MADPYRRRSAPKYRRPLTDEEKAKQVEDSKKAKKTKANKRYRRRQKFKQGKALDQKNINKTLKSIDKVKKPNVNKLKVKGKLDKVTKASKALKGNRVIQKAIGVGKHAGKLRHLKGLAKGGAAAGITMAADWATNQVLDRSFKQIHKRTRGKNMSLKEYRAEMELMRQGKHPKQLAKKQEKEDKKTLGAKNEAVTNPKPKTDSKPSKEKPTKEKASSEKAAWLKKTRNSPAAKNFSDDERWALQQRHRAWKAARKKKKN